MGGNDVDQARRAGTLAPRAEECPRPLAPQRTPTQGLRHRGREALELVQTILDTIPDPIFIKDEDHRWILLNQAFCDFMGHPREALLGKSDHDFFPKEEADVFWRLDDMLFATGEANENEERFTDSSGEVHVISTKKALCRDALGNKILCGVIRDISRRVRAEEKLKSAGEELEARVLARTADLERANAELRESEDRFRSTFEQAAVGIAHVSLDGRFLRVNRRLCEIVGYSPDDLLGRTYREITPREDLVEHEGDVADAMHGLRAALSFDKRYRKKDGTLIWAHVTTTLAHDADGNPTYMITVLEDISARKAAEEALQNSEAQLRQAQKMEAVGRLAGGVAHDFNNLLLVISACAELARKVVPVGGPSRPLLDEIHSTAKRAALLTGQLLAFSRQQVLQVRIVSLNELLEDTAGMLRRLIGEDIELRTNLAPDLGLVRLDANQIIQVLMNLAVNARDAMPDGGVLDIATTNVTVDAALAASLGGVAPGRHVRITVSDTGCGMSDDTRERVFEPFFTTKPVGKGTGLGLSTARGIVEQSGGAISVDSAVDRGTTFHTYLPEVVAPAGSKVASERKARALRGSQTVLLVDDDVVVRDVVRQLLEVNGYVVLVATAPDEAVALAERHRERLHLLLTDVVMPRMQGRELAKRINRIHPEAKVVYMSGYAPTAVVQHGALETESGFLQKPFTEQQLLRTLEDIFE